MDTERVEEWGLKSDNIIRNERYNMPHCPKSGQDSSNYMFDMKD
jgi:hypothetical protein